MKDFTHVTLAAQNFGQALVVHPSVEARNLAELIALARKSPGKLTYANAGFGTASHIPAEVMKAMTGTDILSVPYKAIPEAVTDLIAGRIDMFFVGTQIALQHVQTGKLRAIGHTAATRLASLPDIAPIAETLPGYEVLNWYGVVAPTGTSADTVKRLGDAIRTAMSDAEVRSRVAALGIDPVATSPDEFRRFMDAETTKWTQVIRRGNISAN